MPTTYTHYRFGADVYRQLPPVVQQSIDPYRGLYDIGIHGPDLLFYYKALTKNPINQTGYSIHEKPGYAFFAPAASVIKNMADPEPALAYVYGFLCHFALDSICHPYIERMVRKTGISHGAMEAELDRYFLEKDGHPPLSYRPIHHLIPCIFYARVIERFFPGIGVKSILACIKSQRFYLSLLVVPGPLRNQLVRRVARLKSKGISDMIMPYKKIPECVPMCLHMEALYRKQVADALEMILGYSEYLYGNAPLDQRLNHTFGEF